MRRRPESSVVVDDQHGYGHTEIVTQRGADDIGASPERSWGTARFPPDAPPSTVSACFERSHVIGPGLGLPATLGSSSG
jgi:hypothetical protein